MTNKISLRYFWLSFASIGTVLSLDPCAFAGNTEVKGNMSITTSVIANCKASIVGNINVNFTGYDAVGANTSTGSDLINSSSASIGFTCSKDLSVSIELGYGNNANGTQRYLANTSNGDKILYNIKTPNGADWGDVANNSALTVVSNGTNQATNITIVVPKGQNPSFANGSAYSDTITASMSY